MRRTTVSLPDDLAQAVEREANRRRTSVSEVVRTALAVHLHQEPRRHIPFAGIGHSGHRPTARDMEEILDREWGDALDRDR